MGSSRGIGAVADTNDVRKEKSMKKAKKKGFTLVELLVVIAILSILATVSIVGYTSFLERATVSNDQSVASQLNKYLTAMRVDSTSEFYNESVTPENVWAMVHAALEENGSLDSLEPQSLQYGYDFYFKFNNDGDKYSGGEIVLAKREDVVDESPVAALINFFVGAENDDKYANRPGFFCGNDGNLYFFLNTDGDDLATAVRGFYTIDGVDWKDFKDIVMESKYSNLASKTIFITKYGEYETVGDGEKTQIIVHSDAKAVEVPTISLDNVTEIYASTSIKLFRNEFLNALKSGAKIIIDKTPEEVAKMLEKNNTENFGDKKIYINDSGAYITTEEDGNSYKNIVVDGNNRYDCIYSNPAQEIIGIEAVPVKDKVVNLSDGVYIAWDYVNNHANKVSFRLNANGENPDLPVSYDNISFKLDNADFDGYFNSQNDQTVSVTVNGETKSVDVKFVYVTGATISIGNHENKTEFVLENDDSEGSTSTFEVTLEPKYNITANGITLDTSFVLSSSSLDIIDDTSFKLKSDSKQLYDEKVTAKIAGYCDVEFTVNLYSSSVLTFVRNKETQNIKYIGDANTITIGDIFALNSGMELPKNAELWFTNSYADVTEMPGAVRDGIQNNSNLVDSTLTNVKIKDNTWASISLKFTGGATNPAAAKQTTVGCYIVVPDDNGGYRRISPVVTLMVVEGYNLKTGDNTIFNEDNSKTEGEGKGDEHHKVTNQSVVLIGDYTATSNQYLNLASGKSIYGNYFTINLENARNNSTYIIRVNGGTIIDTIIIGKQYTTVNDSWTKKYVVVGDGYHSDIKEYTADIVCTTGSGSTIENCYIAYGRSPLRICGQTTIKDTVIFGGAYVNINSQASSFDLENVVMVNQYDETYNSTIGGGIYISGDENAIKKTTIKVKGFFAQYNFIEKNETSHFVNNELKAGLNAFFEYDDTKNFVFENEDKTQKYGNAGIIYDKNKLNDTDIEIYVWDEDSKTYAKKLPNGYGAAGISSLLGWSFKITAISLTKDSGVNVSNCLSKTEYYAPTLINTDKHYIMTGFEK